MSLQSKRNYCLAEYRRGGWGRWRSITLKFNAKWKLVSKGEWVSKKPVSRILVTALCSDYIKQRSRFSSSIWSTAIPHQMANKQRTHFLEYLFSCKVKGLLRVTNVGTIGHLAFGTMKDIFGFQVQSCIFVHDNKAKLPLLLAVTQCVWLRTRKHTDTQTHTPSFLRNKHTHINIQFIFSLRKVCTKYHLCYFLHQGYNNVCIKFFRSSVRYRWSCDQTCPLA